MISAVEFCDRYGEWLELIESALTGSHFKAIRKLYETDPEDLISPVACFTSEDHAIGFIFSLVVKTHNQIKEESKDG